MKLALVFAVVASLIVPATASAAGKPADIVAALYREGGAVIEPAKLPGYYSRDLAEALRKDQDDELGSIGFDWLYGAQDFEIAGLAFAETAAPPDRASVTASFSNFGTATEIYWLFCRRPDGQWRVDNVLTPDWNLRELVGLGPETDC